MRLITAIGLAALAAITTIAIIGPDSASPDGDPEITLCKKVETLCTGEMWVNGKLTEIKATDVQFLGFLTVKCETYRVRGRIEKGMGVSLPYGTVDVKKIEKCDKECNDVKIETIDGKINVAATDKYSLLLNLKMPRDKRGPCAYCSNQSAQPAQRAQTPRRTTSCSETLKSI